MNEDIKYIVYDFDFADVIAVFDTHRDAEEFLLSIAEENVFYNYTWNLQHNIDMPYHGGYQNFITELLLDEVVNLRIDPVRYYSDIYFKE